MLRRFAIVIVTIRANADDIVRRTVHIDNNGVIQEYSDGGLLEQEITLEVMQNTNCTVTTTVVDSEGFTTVSPVALFRAGNLEAPQPDTIAFRVVDVVEREVPDDPVPVE